VDADGGDGAEGGDQPPAAGGARACCAGGGCAPPGPHAPLLDFARDGSARLGDPGGGWAPPARGSGAGDTVRPPGLPLERVATWTSASTSLAAPGARDARYLYQSGEKAFAQARYHASAASYQTAIETLDQLGNAADLTLKLDACLGLWSARTSFGQYDGLRELGDKAGALARALDDGPRLAQVQVRQAQAVYSHGTIPGTLESTIGTAHEAFEGAGPRDVRTRSYAQYLVGCACRDLGRIVEATREFGVGLALFEPVVRHGEEPGLIHSALGAPLRREERMVAK